MYIQVEELRNYLGITSETDDALLIDAISDAQDAIERHTGRVFQVSTNTSKYFTPGVDTCGNTLYLDEDLASINSITNGDGTTISASAYVLRPRNLPPYREIVLKSSYGLFWTYQNDPEDAITVSGKWGWSVEPDGAIHRATLRLSAFFYKQKDAQTFEYTASSELGTVRVRASIPKDIIEILEPYRKLIA